ncbi:GTP cyclohydrolase I FolE2 [bacterium]|nr:GTP cyclohydrolase I FolE2 [bacterium]
MGHSQLSAHLPDVQTNIDGRGVPIQKVGVSGIRLPLQLLEKGGGVQRTVGDIAMHVSLGAKWRGTHMSRFTELLNTFTQNPDHTIASKNLAPLAEQMLDVLETDSAFVEVEMDFFRSVLAPESKIPGVAPYRAHVEVWADRANGAVSLGGKTGVLVTGQTCCPCSKEISDYNPETGLGRGAHSQHGEVRILVWNDPRDIIWYEDLIDIAEASVSAPSYPILKRVDERHTTIQAYENPCFVEDVLRNAAVRLRQLPHITRFEVEVTNHEVIHFHKATGNICEDVDRA